MPVTSAGEVITLAYPLLHELLRHPLDQPFNGTVASDNILESLTKTHAALESFVNTTSSKSLEWIDISSAEVEFTRKEASLGNLVFDSVTIELPFQAEYMQRQLTLSENKTTTNITYEHHAFSDNGEIDYFFDINVKEECGEAGCVVSPRGEGQTMAIVDMGVQVRALALCVDEESSEEDLKKTIEVAISQDGATQTCARLSSTSFAVVSLAQRVEGDQMDKADGVIRLKNARKFYSISIARVSWSHKDISSMLGEACSTQAECMGLSIPLSSTSDLVVGHKAIAMEDLRVLRSGGEHWPYLVATSSQEVDSSGNLKGDMIFPSNFKFESESLDLKDQECESERGRLLQSIKVNHWFSTHSLDSAFLSAVLWLFQNGVVIESESSSSVASSTDPTPEISARLVVRVPPKSALYTYAGCSILVLLSVCVLLFSKQTEAQIEKHFRPVHLAQMLVDTSSELCPSTRLVQSDLLNVGGDLLSSSESLTEFEIVSLTLRHRTITTTMIQVPKGPSVSVS
ncbi:hypothetical protein Poli38472_000984 [Pythium oligandrum]|uniref:Uncharacterized protein n=1 Tax=Pythium oligandrum TaxID=41045 RepID=A0A8K1CEX3_PYTOL|nr:hypothetical protein Poli38472_000984 [Pythium oligandrum]|eukprot:TMW60942.1 hypothetical protein Poli38472_000984 [Pythium oligandrum]